MPRISQFNGIAIYMYYGDHAPPHFHAIIGEFDAAVEIITATVLDGKIPPKAWLLVREWTESRQGELTRNWDLASKATAAMDSATMALTEVFEMILRITEFQVVGPHVLKLAFNDGTRKTVNVYPLLSGPVFKPLKDPGFFARVLLDPVAGTVVWPNDADLAPEALHELCAAEETTAA